MRIARKFFEKRIDKKLLIAEQKLVWEISSTMSGINLTQLEADAWIYVIGCLPISNEAKKNLRLKAVSRIRKI